MKKILLVLAALFLFSGCQTEEAEPVETTAATEIETVGEIKVTAASESDFLYKIINNKVTINQYIGGESVVVIPETIEGCPVQKVKSDFLKDSSVSEVIYPANFTVFGGLSNCPDLKIVRFSSSPEQITDPFSLCEGLTEIDIPDGGAYRTIDGIVYTADGKTLVAYPRGRTGSFHILDGVEAIGSKAFYASRLSEIVLSDSVQTIGDYAFAKNEKLTEVTIPASVRTIGDYAFSESGIEKVTLSEGLEEVGFLAFKKTKITELYLPDSLVKCSSGIAESEVLISASYPVEGLKPLLLHENLEFRDETTLQEAFRMAEEQFFEKTYPQGFVFVDLSGDRFPELAVVDGKYMLLLFFDMEVRQWRQFDDEWGEAYVWIAAYHLCYERETDTYIYYSDPYDYYPWWEIEDVTPMKRQECIRFTENGGMVSELYSENIKDLTQAEIIQTIDFPKMLADWDVDFDDPYGKFILVTDSFAEEPNGELQQKPLQIYGKQAESYPYFDRYYPKELHLSVAGVDVLRGEEQLSGVSFDHGVLTLENAVIDSSGCNYTIKASNLNKITIELIGENKIVSDSSCSLFNVDDIPIVFKGSGSLETPAMVVKNISLTESVKITENPRISYYVNTIHAYGIYADRISLSGEASFECRRVKAFSITFSDYAHAEAQYINAGLTLTDHARLRIQMGYCTSVSLSDDSVMDVAAESPNREYYSQHGMLDVEFRILINGNARLFADSSLYENDAIRFLYTRGNLTISDNGTLEIKGNSVGNGIRFGDDSGVITVNADAKIKIDDARECIYAGKIILNGGTLDLNAMEGKPVIRTEPPGWSDPDFKPGYFINGEILSENISDRKMLYDIVLYDIVLCDGEDPVSNYFIQVREREQTSE